MPQEFKPTWLYVKRCGHCGLLYFGKTIRDPYTYNGSGHLWTNHIRKHGIENVETLATRLFKNREKCQRHALRFSRKHDVANSPLWANLCDENGTDGGVPGFDPHKGANPMSAKSWFTDGHNEWILFPWDPLVTTLGLKNGRSKYIAERSRSTNLGNIHKLGRHHTKEAKERISLAHIGHTRSKGRKLSLETRQKMSAASPRAARGKKWYNDGRRDFMLLPTDPCVQNLNLGRLPFLSEEGRKRIGDRTRGKTISEKTREKISQSLSGRIFSEDHRAALSRVASSRGN